MSETIYLQGHCDHCREAIEFPAESSGQTAACPICNRITRFHATVENAPVSNPPNRTAIKTRRSRLLIGLGIVASILAVGAAVLFSRSRHDVSSATGATPTTVPPTNSPPTSEIKSAVETPVNAPAKARFLSDLKAGPVTLEKARGSSLVYAVGVLRNESEYQRFGVTIEVELTDAGGSNAGLAKDYRAVIEPRQEWGFRALILNSKAVRGAVTRIHEE